jgi:dipeptidyl aminopeptidase/acylaminoacyl peptidase
MGLSSIAAVAAAPAPRAIGLGDFDRLRHVANPACSPDGRWIAYTVEEPDIEADERKSSIWMVDFEGAGAVRLTQGVESVGSPEFSPDGRYVSFLAQRAGDAKSQIYLLDRRGGEPEAITHVTGDIGAYAWAPDGARLVISMSAGEDAPGADAPGAAAPGAKTPKPIVIDRMHFKEDITGYLTSADRAQLYVLALATKKLEPLTQERQFDDTMPKWSPDGRSIAYVSNHASDPDVSDVRELYVIESKPGSVPRKIADFYAPFRFSVLWSADGSRIVYSSGIEVKRNAYAQDHLNLVTVADGTRRELAAGLDRALYSPVLTGDANTIAAILEEDRSEIPVLVRLDTGSLQRQMTDERSLTDLCSAAGHVAAVASADRRAPEIHALEGHSLRKLSAHNDAFMGEVAFGAVEDISFPSRDGTEVHGLLTKPVDYRPGRLYPTLVWLHGGPNEQDSHGLNFSTYALALQRQWFAAHGYVVLAINYRGSGGRGEAFSAAIAADWGRKDVEDVLAGVDHLVRAKIADPQRLGIGGWSYGAILTDYTIASDHRFKAAVSGAGSGNQLALYGTDQYITQDNAEIGPPWRQPARWMQISYPLLHADRIDTPTLFEGGDRDFNVPIAGSEQMYQALRTLGVPTELIVYPGQFHELTRPSYIKFRMQRDLDWFDRHLAPGPR